jgi:hypothetical protein
MFTYSEIQVDGEDAQLITILTEIGFHSLSRNEMNLRIYYLVYQLISGNSKKVQESCDITCILN